MFGDEISIAQILIFLRLWPCQVAPMQPATVDQTLNPCISYPAGGEGDKHGEGGSME